MNKIQLRCMCCDRILEGEKWDDNPLSIHPVYDGLIFRSNGNFGSTIFDPMPIGNEEFLQVVICDFCVMQRDERVTRVYNIKTTKTAESESFEVEEENDQC